MTMWSQTPPAPMRREQILAIIERDGFAKVTTLSQIFGTSEVTIRADLDALAAGHTIQRVHGGAVAGLRPAGLERSYEQNLLTSSGEKRRIGKAAAGLVESHQSVILDAGTTTTAVARALVQREDLENVVIITNSLSIALELEPATNRYTVVVTGGTLRARQHSLVDPMADAVLERVRADLAFVSCNGIDAGDGVTNMSLPDADVKRRMLLNASRAVVVADHTKLGERRLSRVVPINAVDVLVTSTEADATEVEKLREAGVTVLQA
ncbi:DeoR/GlpR family DNA-binding transcription regulator [Herbiconiux sp. L3-i23]|uniref:DeoR/GlpR family DNA-binding transcription regulator n=1 Tax=Herbiconiux sp. L3-i23 TaxID=2905871 RepID=UPI0020571616|nr:DeoR/GlpR family DNA-binding transcription regulator [Herbiconiux sp. L3-i23]BDI22111.1 DeoR family transcriptional regulator [Herbiconiux sp. L3-i23]